MSEHENADQLLVYITQKEIVTAMQTLNIFNVDILETDTVR
jgi:hypothetical protein